MNKLGLPVPAGFTLGTNICTYYNDHDQNYPPELRSLVDAALVKLEEQILLTEDGIELLSTYPLELDWI